VNVCKRCGKENQPHYRFCLTCGGELTREQVVSRATPSPFDPAAQAAMRQAPSAMPAPAPAPPPGPRTPTPAAGVPVLPLGTPKSGSSQQVVLGGPARPATGPVVPPPSPIGNELEWAWDAARPATTQMETQPAPAPPAPVAPAPVAPAPVAPAPPAPVVTADMAPVGSDPTPCPSCGHLVQAGFRFCGACGARIEPGAPAPAPASGGRTMFMAQGHAPVAPQPRGKLVLIRPDGTEGGTLALNEGETLVGRGLGAMFDGDAYLSPRHAQFVLNAAGLVVRDLHSLNGVFLKLGDEEEVGSGTIFRIGQELLRFDSIQPPMPIEDGTEVMGSPNPGFWGRLVVIVGRDVDGSAFPLFGDAVVLGRERGDILFPEDGYVSGTHARLSFRDGRVYLADLGSSNGTFLRALGERPVPSGAFLLMGQQLFKVTYT
jgi:hypothetical protein